MHGHSQEGTNTILFQKLLKLMFNKLIAIGLFLVFM
jgi:hypothetical protein